MRAILHTPRSRQGGEAWSTKVLPPAHEARVQGAWLCVSETACGKTPGARQKSLTVGQRWSCRGLHCSPTQQRPECQGTRPSSRREHGGSGDLSGVCCACGP